MTDGRPEEEMASESFELQRMPKQAEDALDEEWRNASETGLGSPAPRSYAESFELYTPDEERSVVRKLDRHLVLFVAFLYMLSFLDRSSTFSNPQPQ